MSHLVNSFYALENTRVPLFIDIGGSAVSVALAFAFTRLISHSAFFTSMLTSVLGVPGVAHPEVLGISLGFSLGLAVNAALLYSVLVRFAARVFKKRQSFPLAALLKIILASLGAGAATYATRAQFSEALPHTPTFPIFIQGFIAGSVGLLIYVGILLLLKSEDVKAARRYLGWS
jgi:peptidoglycan biosynthesis protein MviN/MurJ (putative lipid II flippase)